MKNHQNTPLAWRCKCISCEWTGSSERLQKASPDFKPHDEGWCPKCGSSLIYGLPTPETILLPISPREVDRIFSERTQVQLRRPVNFQPKNILGASDPEGKWSQRFADQWYWETASGMLWPPQASPFGSPGTVIRPVETFVEDDQQIAVAMGYTLEVQKVWIQQIQAITWTEYIKSGMRPAGWGIKSKPRFTACAKSFEDSWNDEFPFPQFHEGNWVWACEFTISPEQQSPQVLHPKN